jgi:hypothetical protein
MRNQMIAILVSLLLCATLLVSANPTASVEEQQANMFIFINEKKS